MSEARSVLQHSLSRYSFNLRLWKGLQFALWCALGVQIAMLALIPMRELLGIASAGHLLLFATAAGFVSGGLVGLLASQSAHATARFLDAKFHLQERLQTALELTGIPSSPEANLLAREAVGVLKRESREVRGDGLRALQWAPLAFTTLVGLLLLNLPPILETVAPVREAEAPALPSLAQSRTNHGEQNAEHGEDDALAPAETQVMAAPGAFRESALGDDPRDFASFVSSGDDRLKLLEAHGEESSPGDAQKPIRIQPQAPSQAAPGFESDGPSNSEVSTRMTEFEEAMKRSSAAAQEKGAAQQQTARASSPADSDEHKAKASGVEAPVQAPQAETSSANAEEQGKGASKEAATPANETPGTPSSHNVETPSRGPAKPTHDPDMQTARFGGGQYPHNAPGAGFPDWMRGDADPHFMDAGQGEGASTGKTSGQAGVGHATLNTGPESPTLDLPSMQDLHVSGHLQQGDRSTYETEMLGRGDGDSAKVKDSDILAQYQFRAEEQMSRNQVPPIFREHVQNYFARIQ